MTLKEAIGSGVQSELYRGAGQYATMVVLGLVLFGPNIFRSKYEWNFSSKDSINARIVVDAIGLAVTYVLAETLIKE